MDAPHWNLFHLSRFGQQPDREWRISLTGLAILALFLGLSNNPALAWRPKPTAQSICRTNLLMLEGAVEMYEMDHPKDDHFWQQPSSDWIKELVSKKLLREAVVCPYPGMESLRSPYSLLGMILGPGRLQTPLPLSSGKHEYVVRRDPNGSLTAACTAHGTCEELEARIKTFQEQEARETKFWMYSSASGIILLLGFAFALFLYWRKRARPS